MSYYSNFHNVLLFNLYENWDGERWVKNHEKIVTTNQKAKIS